MQQSPQTGDLSNAFDYVLKKSDRQIKVQHINFALVRFISGDMDERVLEFCPEDMRDICIPTRSTTDEAEIIPLLIIENPKKDQVFFKKEEFVRILKDPEILDKINIKGVSAGDAPYDGCEQVYLRTEGLFGAAPYPKSLIKLGTQFWAVRETPEEIHQKIKNAEDRELSILKNLSSGKTLENVTISFDYER